MLVPAEPEAWVRTARHDLSQVELFECVELLSRYENFALVGLIVSEGSRTRAVYVHAKVMLVDDAWATIGSCNLHAKSMTGHTEMNASIWDAEIVRALRCELLTQHLGKDTFGLGDRAAMRLFRETAQCNSIAKKDRKAGWQGLAVTLDTSTYGR